jgi:hypothetical protein
VTEYSLFLIMWDEYGLECCLDVTQAEKDMVWAELSNTTSPKIPIHLLMMRARVNSHRHYEIYTVRGNEGVSADDLIELFTTNPQGAADLIRQSGIQVYSNRLTKSPVIT